MSARYNVKGNAYAPRSKIIHVLQSAHPRKESFYFGGPFEEDINREAEKIIAQNNWLNNCSGHKYRVQRKRKLPMKKGRVSGGGFSFRPEIPYRHVGNGEFSFDECDELEFITAEDFDDFQRPKYQRKNHDAQSMPKVEFAVVRDWYNKHKKRFPKSEHSRADRVRTEIIANPRCAFGRHGMYP